MENIPLIIKVSATSCCCMLLVALVVYGALILGDRNDQQTGIHDVVNIDDSQQD